MAADPRRIPVARILDRLDNVRRNGRGWTARCPGHDDRANSLSVKEADDGRVLIYCFVGCDVERVVDALGLEMRDLFPDNDRGGRGGHPRGQHRNTATPSGCTLAEYAAAKRLPLDTLRAFGLSDISYQSAPAVRIPYRDHAGTDAAVRFRVRLEKSLDSGDRFRWKSGAKPCLYGRDRLPLARDRGYVALVEGSPTATPSGARGNRPSASPAPPTGATTATRPSSTVSPPSTS